MAKVHLKRLVFVWVIFLYCYYTLRNLCSNYIGSHYQCLHSWNYYYRPQYFLVINLDFKYVNYHLWASHSPVFLCLNFVAFKYFDLSNFLLKALNIVLCPLILTIHDLSPLRTVFVNDLLHFSNFSSFTFIFFTEVFVTIKCSILAALFQRQVIFIFFIIYLKFFAVLNFTPVFIFLN